MYRFLFSNRLVALAFVAMIVLGVRTLIGTQSDEGALTRTAARIEANVRSMQTEARQFQAKQSVNRVNPDREIVRPVPVATGFAPDEELIDEGPGDVPLEFPAEPMIEGAVVVEMPPDIIVPDVVDGN